MAALFTYGTVVVALLASPAAAASKSTYESDALDAANFLNQNLYDASTGLWNSGWWPSGNQVTTLADFAAVSPADYLSVVSGIIENTFRQAPAFNGPNNSNGVEGTFLNDFYDDEMWWLLAWIKVYDVTQNSTYLDTARAIFEDVKVVNGSCGGHLQNKNPSTPFVDAISDGQYVAAAAGLANRVSGVGTYYSDFAQAHTDWWYSSGLFDSTGNGTILNDINTSTCAPEGPTLTYNQGAIVGGLAEMHTLTGEQMYLDTAAQIAHGTIQTMVDGNGILTEQFGTPSGDGDQFKGVFARNLGYLQAVAPDAAYVAFLQKNADSIVASDRNAQGQLGVLWQGPITELTAASHGSAMDCLVAAAAVS